MRSSTPKDKSLGLASSNFARRYFRNRVFFLLLLLLRCFSSQRSPPQAMYLPMDTWAILMQVSPFGHSRIDGYLRLPETFRSLSRPSSALSAKAFPLCSFSLDLAECSSDTTFLFCFCLKSINLSFSAFSRFFWLFLSLYSVFKVQVLRNFILNFYLFRSFVFLFRSTACI